MAVKGFLYYVPTLKINLPFFVIVIIFFYSFTSNIKIMKTIRERKADFLIACNNYQDQYGFNMVHDFFEYWTEHNYNSRKMRFEKEKTFDLGKRLARWYKNSKKWGKETKPISLAEKMKQQYGLK